MRNNEMINICVCSINTFRVGKTDNLSRHLYNSAQMFVHSWTG